MNQTMFHSLLNIVASQKKLQKSDLFGYRISDKHCSEHHFVAIFGQLCAPTLHRAFANQSVYERNAKSGTIYFITIILRWSFKIFLEFF